MKKTDMGDIIIINQKERLNNFIEYYQSFGFKEDPSVHKNTQMLFRITVSILSPPITINSFSQTKK